MLNFIIILLFLAGIGLIVYSVIKFKPAESSSITEQTLEKLQSTIAEADNAMEELSKLSNSIFEEMTAKYKELLYLYSLIDKAKAEKSPQPSSDSETSSGTSPVASPPAFVSPTILVEDSATETHDQNFMSAFNSANPKHGEIRSLFKQGLTVAEIAKTLNLGQGEVKLVLDMERGVN